MAENEAEERVVPVASRRSAVNMKREVRVYPGNWKYARMGKEWNGGECYTACEKMKPRSTREMTPARRQLRVFSSYDSRCTEQSSIVIFFF